jgi:dTDP-4-dehydrorhamnose 3,5-epimerase-like enzyme
MKIELIHGGLHVDQRGIVSFVNDFDFKGVQRFYTIRAHKPGEVRGWIGHKREHKWFTALAGTILIGVVEPDDWVNPSKDLPIERFTLSALKPAVLHVPPGHATASVALSADALLCVFSSEGMQPSSQDDYRFDLTTWILK